MNKFKNQIKLYYLTGRGSDRTKKIMNIIENVHSKMKKDDNRLKRKYPKSTFYTIEDKIYFELNSKFGWTYVKYPGFWEKFESEFGLNYKEIKWLTQYTLEQHLLFPTKPTLFNFHIR